MDWYGYVLCIMALDGLGGLRSHDYLGALGSFFCMIEVGSLQMLQDAFSSWT